MVTAIVNNPGIAAGQVLDWTGCRTFRTTKTTGILTRGDLLVPDTGTSPDSVKISPASATVAGPFSVCMETTTSAATVVSIATGGVQCLTADGTIEIGKWVQPASATAGQVIAFAATDVTATPVEAGIESAAADWSRVVGKCLGFADNYNTSAPTAPVDGDLVAVEMRI